MLPSVLTRPASKSSDCSIKACKARKCEHIHPILKTLYWLPVTHRIQYKCQLFPSIPSLEQPLSICLISFNLILQQDNYDQYPTHEPLSPLVSTHHKNGERSFSYAGPSVWNNLPQTIHQSDSASSVKAALKTHLFNHYF